MTDAVIAVVSAAMGAAVTFVATYGYQAGVALMPWGWFLPLSLPGAVVALTLNYLGFVSTVHDPLIGVIRGVDFLLYSFVAFKVWKRLANRRTA